MEFLRHPLYGILAVLIIGAASGALVHATERHALRTIRGWITAILAGIGAAFIGFHFAMLSNVATGVILMPFAVALVVALAVSFARRDGAR